MKFLCDVHIPYKLVKLLNDKGFEAEHINKILDKWHTSDKKICQYADKNNYTIITKDSDFRDSYFVKKTPKKLIKINLGNVSNNNLQTIFDKYVNLIAKYDSRSSFLIEIDKEDITIVRETNK